MKKITSMVFLLIAFGLSSKIYGTGPQRVDSNESPSQEVQKYENPDETLTPTELTYNPRSTEQLESTDLSYAAGMRCHLVCPYDQWGNRGICRMVCS